MLEFVDTNILVYAHDKGAGNKHRKSIDLLARLATSGDGVLSTQVLCELYSALTRKLDVSAREAENILADLAPWQTHRPTPADVLSAARLCREQRLSWWDALIVTSAQVAGCSVLWSEDLTHHRKFGGVTVKNPFAA